MSSENKKTLYVGNLPFTSTQEGIQKIFSACGEVYEVNIILDRDTGRPRGFCFVVMSPEGAEAAVRKLNGQEFEGRPLTVNEARERDASPPRGGRDRSSSHSGGRGGNYGNNRRERNDRY
jgi:cold-inducible RNA-binding protein